MTTKKKDVAPKPTNYKPNDDRVVRVPISEIGSNSENPRESAPHLTAMGYGIFTKLEGSDKDAVIPMGLSQKADERGEFVKLIDKFEPEIANMGASFLSVGQIHPIIVRLRTDGNPGYDLVVGCRRVLAAVYNYCSTGGTVPAALAAIVKKVEGNNKALYMAFVENAMRLQMSPMEEARWFGQMSNAGMKAKDIQEVTGTDHQTVRNRLQLLALDPEMQDKVHTGQLGMVKALEIVKGNADPKNPKNTSRGSKGGPTEQRDRAPTLANFRKMYETRDDLHEKVREFLALEVLHVEYVTYKELAKLREAATKAEEKVKNGAAVK